MKRHLNPQPRKDFQQRLESIGMNYWNLPSGPEKLPYWQEDVYYGFSETEVDRIQEATQDLHNMSIEMIASMVKSGDYPSFFGLEPDHIALIEQSWNRGDKSFYGRFDLAFDLNNDLKMLEYNGDTPVSILECSVAQWDFIQEINGLPTPLRIQYNMLDEQMIATWQKLFNPQQLVHFAASGGFRHEDWGNLVYIMDTALRAGLNVKEVKMQDIGITANNSFVDLDNILIDNCFKLYPWEWMVDEQYGKHLLASNTRWLEPEWKMLLSNKAMLVKLWEMFPNHPNLLPAYSETNKPTRALWAKKAIHGREGSNIYQTKFADGEHLCTSLAEGSHVVPEYDKWGYIYQYWMDIKKYDGMTPIIGSWVIGDEACGMSIREDKNVVTGNDAFFAPHIFVPYDFEEECKNFFM